MGDVMKALDNLMNVSEQSIQDIVIRDENGDICQDICCKSFVPIKYWYDCYRLCFEIGVELWNETNPLIDRQIVSRSDIDNLCYAYLVVMLVRNSACDLSNERTRECYDFLDKAYGEDGSDDCSEYGPIFMGCKYAYLNVLNKENRNTRAIDDEVLPYLSWFAYIYYCSWMYRVYWFKYRDKNLYDHTVLGFPREWCFERFESICHRMDCDITKRPKDWDCCWGVLYKLTGAYTSEWEPMLNVEYNKYSNVHKDLYIYLVRNNNSDVVQFLLKILGICEVLTGKTVNVNLIPVSLYDKFVKSVYNVSDL